MITYCSKFIPNFATLTDPLRHLLKANTPWVWNNDHKLSITALQRLLLSSDILSYFNPTAETQIVTDASPIGLGAVISQLQNDGSWRPISYASRALTPVEQRYSQIEKESLAILFAIKRFRMYLYGMPFTVYTDHKLLVSMFTSVKCQLPPRIERWVAQLMPYNFKVLYLPGCKNSTDFLSRSNPLPDSHSRHNNVENYVNLIAEHNLTISLPLTTIQAETKKDPTLSSMQECLRTATYDNIPKNYQPIRHHISSTNGLVLYKNKIVIPTSLQHTVMNLAHEGHQGIVRTKQRLRTKVWWPNMSCDIENFISTCHSCQVVSSSQLPTSLQMTPIPSSSWLMIGCDLCGPFPSGEHLLVCVDYYSRYPEVEIIHKTTSIVISSKLRKLFCRYGCPELIITDNGPQFQKNTEFSNLMKEFGVKHIKVAPYHPQANGEVERFNRTLKKCIQTAIADGNNWRRALENFLLCYRSTPHATTGIAPADLMFGRQIKDKLPIFNANPPQKANSVATRDNTQKAIMKRYANEKRHARPHSIHPGDSVLINNKKNIATSLRLNGILNLVLLPKSKETVSLSTMVKRT